MAALSGCGPTGLYHWGNYEQALYDYTKQPGEIDAYVASLGAIIDTGEQSNNVPPGLYAEYGYALMVAGRGDEAMTYFEKERDKWPEAEKMMGLIIDGTGLETGGADVDDSAEPTQADASQGVAPE
jgi:hypothetical protein